MTTLAQSAYDSLRDDIVRGRLAPGQKLGLELLKARYGLSFSPLREAMNRLQAERLVVPATARGFQVAPVSSAELWDTTEVRVLVETEALRRSIAQGGDEWEQGVVASLHGLDLLSGRLRDQGAPPSEADMTDLEARHKEFHFALIAACGSPRLLLLFEQFYAETQRYRLPAFARPRHGAAAARDISAEHKALHDAALAREADRAAGLLAAHYRLTATQVDPGGA